MARTIVAIYESFYLADQAVRDLRASGFPQEMMEILMRPRRTKVNSSTQITQPKKVVPEIRVSGLKAGSQIGVRIGISAGIAGTILALAGLLPDIPGTSLSLTVTSLFAACAAVGGLSGGLLGQLLGLNIPENEARQYARNVRDNDVLVAVLADWDSVDPVIEALNKFNPLEIQQKTLVGLRPGRVSLVAAAQAAMAKHGEHND